MTTAAVSYRTFLDAAGKAVDADAASVQVYDDERRGLRLAASRGFHYASAAFWELVSPASASACGAALLAGDRVVVPDVEAEAGLAASADLNEYRRSRLRAVQSTPLIADDGRLLGMLSTHWRRPHEPSFAELRRIDALARETAAAVAQERELVLRKRMATASRQYAAGSINYRVAEAVGSLETAFRRMVGTGCSAVFVCACGREECRYQTVTIPLEVYARVRASPHRFLVKPGHETEIDDVVEQGDGFGIVEVKPEYRLDPRT